MADRPIIFSAPMGRAILDGRKSQTRRVLKPQPDHLQVYYWKGECVYDCEYRVWCWKGHVGADNWDDITTQIGPFLPYAIGDRLWVKETWSDTLSDPNEAVYRADGERHHSVLPWRSPTPGPDRENFRSATPMGFARAVFAANCRVAARSAA